MKKRILTYLGMVFLAWITAAPLFAQLNFNMPYNNGPVTQTVGNAGNNPVNFFDNGGAGGNYSNSSGANSVVTFAPATAGNRIRVNFLTFQTEAAWDAMYIYNGANTSAPLISVATCNMSPNTAIPGTPHGTTIGGFQGGGFWGTDLAGRQVFSTGAGGNLTLRFLSDASVTFFGWTATVTQEPIPCAMPQPANVVTNVGPNCGPAAVTLNIPAVPGCAAGGSYQISIDGGPFAAVTAGGTFTTAPLAAGIHTVTWVLFDANGCQVSGTTSTINIQDTEPPVITCPASISQTLLPGECSLIVTWPAPTVSDNCPFFPPAAPVQIPASFSNHGSGLAFTLSGNLQPGGLFFNITNTTGTTRTITGFGVRVGNPAFGNVTPPRTLNMWQAPTYVGNQTNAGAWTSLGNAILNPIPPYFATGTGALAQAVMTTQVVLAPGATRGFHIFGPNWCPVFNYTFAPQPAMVNGGFSLIAGEVSFGQFGPLFQAGSGNSAVPNIQINYTAPVLPPPAVQTSGLPSGSQFPIGTTQNCFSITDLAGNTSSCCFNVTVNEFPNATQTLVCNDNVQVSLDQDCISPIGADAILEGGPY
ncbi:MAG: HYR domain-containing protein, partial [Bacteroidetes bacterium]|nr:HYR domain-containing protein [Bacteroidota bacterium]